MPLEVRELVIKATIETRSSPSEGTPQHDFSKLKKEIVRECLEKIRIEQRRRASR